MGLSAAVPPHLLVVDDDLDIREAVQWALEEEGYAVTLADSLPASLAMLDERLFHFVLTDLFYQQGQDPLDSIQPLLVGAAPIPVGVMTAWPVPDEAATQTNLAFLLHKPFELHNLSRMVQAGVRPRLSGKQQQVQIVEQFFAALDARDWKRLARLCTPDVTVAPLSALAVSASAPRSGLLTYRAALERRFFALPGFTIEGVRVFARPFGLAARYAAHWQSYDGVVHRVAGSAHFQFHGARIAQIDTSL